MLSVFIEPWNSTTNQLGEHCCVEGQIRREGDTISVEEEIASVVLKAPVIFPQAAPSDHGEDFCWLTRWWTGEELLDWQMIGIPLKGLIGDNNGAPVTVGSAVRYVPKTVSEDVFETYSIFLDLYHKGPVSIRFDVEGRPTLLQTGIPFWGLYSWLETRNRIRISEALGGGAIFAKWAVGLLATRYPWPILRGSVEPYQIQGLTDGMRSHFWFNKEAEIEEMRSVTMSSNDLIGVSTGWSGDRMQDALKYALDGLYKLEYRGRQIRPGIYNSIRDRWLKAKEVLYIP